MITVVTKGEPVKGSGRRNFSRTATVHLPRFPFRKLQGLIWLFSLSDLGGSVLPISINRVEDGVNPFRLNRHLFFL